MNSRNTILNELKSLESSLAPDIQEPVFAVPAGYFEGFADSVLSRIRMQNAASAEEEISGLSPLLAGLSRKMPFEVPANYFQENSKELAFVGAEDEESLVLSFISKDMPYEVPLGYFANFPEQMTEKLAAPKGRVVTMMRRKWMRMAVAAIVTGIIALSGFLYFNRDKSIDPLTTNEVVANEIKKASTEELDEFLDKNDVAVSTNSSSVTATPKKEMKTLFQDVSDQELEAFLQEIPSDELLADDFDTELLAN
jgi:hypothetical protein